MLWPRLTLCFLPVCRFSVNVFQPPFQSGRTSPEASQCRGDLPLMAAVSPESVGPRDEAVGGSATSDLDLESQDQQPEEQAQCAQASALHTGDLDSLSSSQTSTRTVDSGFSEPLSSASCCSLDPHAEKETSCEKAVRPEGESAGLSGHAGYFLFLRPGLITSPTFLCSCGNRLPATERVGIRSRQSVLHLPAGLEQQRAEAG